MNQDYKILLTGGSGTLGTELLNLFKHTKYTVLSPRSSELDIQDYVACRDWFKINKPDLVIHSAAYTNVKESEQNFIKSININIIGTCNMIRCCEEQNIKLVYISTDYVFDGEKGNYKTTDAINPLSKYAKSKAAGELAVRMYENSLVIRTSFYGYNFPYEKAFVDQWSSKDYVDIIAPKILKESTSNKTGISHIAGTRRTIFDIAKERASNVVAAFRNEIKYKIPHDTSLEIESSN